MIDEYKSYQTQQLILNLNQKIAPITTSKATSKQFRIPAKIKII